jgi:hypothetical protein
MLDNTEVEITDAILESFVMGLAGGVLQLLLELHGQASQRQNLLSKYSAGFGRARFLFREILTCSENSPLAS